MSVCKGCCSIVNDVTFVDKGAETSSSEFDCFYVLLLRTKNAEGRDSRLNFFQRQSNQFLSMCGGSLYDEDISGCTDVKHHSQ